MWDLPGPGLEPGSPALAGRFLTTAPPGESQDTRFLDLNAIDISDQKLLSDQVLVGGLSCAL